MLVNRVKTVVTTHTHCRSTLKVAAAFVFGTFFAYLCAAQTLVDLGSQNFSQRSLQNVLQLYQRAGVPLIFSSALVVDDFIVQESPPAGEPIARLQALLELYGLGLDTQAVVPHSTAPTAAWLVVKKPPAFNARIDVIDAHTGLPLFNATLVEQGRTSITLDNRAFFNVDVFADSARLLSVSHADCQTQVLALAQLQQQNRLKLVCDNSFPIEETLVVASFYRWQKETTASQKKLTQDDIAPLPTRGNDPMLAVASLPGIANSGASAKLNIRGGASDELLILFNGVELIEPFHLKDFQGLLSGINNHNVERLDVYSGGYPAQYGSKMSGVIDITPIQPTGENDNLIEFNPIYSALMLADVISTDGAEAQDKPESYYIASVRRGHLETTLRTFEESFGSPRFNDTFLQFHSALNARQSIDVGYLSIRDDIALHLQDEQSNEQAQSIYNSQYGWLKATINHAKNVTSEIQLSSSYSKTKRQGELLGVDPNNGEGDGSNLDGEGRVSDYRLISLQRLGYVGLWQFEKNQRLTFGGHAQYSQADYDYSAHIEVGNLGRLLGLPATRDWSVVQQPSGIDASGFLSWYSLPSDNLMTEFGVRADMQTYTVHTQHQLSPRMALNYQFTDDIALKASAGRFYQASGIMDLDVTAGQHAFYSPQKADHYIVGVDYQITETLNLGVEGYLKKLFSPRPRAENLFNPYVLLPELADDRVYLAPSSATAQGLEFMLNYDADDALRTWFTFALSEVEDNVQGRLERRGWNQVMAASVGALYRAPSWSLSARAYWHSGWPTSVLPNTINNLAEPLNYSRNHERLSDFLSLDVRLNKQWHPASYLLEGYLDITNFTNRNNIGYLDVNAAATPDGYVINSEAKTLYSIFPMMGLTLYF